MTIIGPLSSVSEMAGRPAPDDPRKPSSPTGLRPENWRFAFRTTLRKFGENGLTDLAAGLTYFAVLSLFPALLALVALLSLAGQGGTALTALVEQFQASGFWSASSSEALGPAIAALTTAPAPGLGLAIGTLGAIWSASNYVQGFGRAMNRIYEVPEGRGVIRLNVGQYALTAALLVLVAVALLLIAVSGPVAQAVGTLLNIGDAALAAWEYGKAPALVVLFVALLALLYRFAPNVKQPRMRWVIVGAVAALIGAGAASAAFALYLSHTDSYAATYGALAGIIVFLLWLWLVNVALLFGAELNSELERSRQLQAGIAAEELIQLPPRAMGAAKKAEQRARADVEEGHRLRLKGGEPGAAPAPAPDATTPTRPRRKPIDHYTERG